jgi:phosphomannomutase
MDDADAADAADADVISFGTDGWRATLDEFTLPRVRLVGRAVADSLDEPGPVAVGYDARESSRTFADALAEELAAAGRKVKMSERDCPTPVVAWTVARDCAGGLVVTASHNPPEYNGVKFLPADGAPALPAVTTAIEERLAAVAGGVDRDGGGRVEEADFLTPYTEHALAFADADLSGLSVVYDAMHGSGRGVTGDLLAAAGAEVTRLRADRDPDFGNTPPEPVPDHAGELIERVTGGSADLGVINDGDADRLGIVTPERGFLDPNVLLAVLYEHRLEREPGDAVRTVSTSSLVDRVAESRGHAVHETAVGFKWVAEAMAETGAVVGGEESGGFGVTAHLRNKDGVLLALLVAAAEAERPVDDRVDALVAAHGGIHQDRVSVDCPDDRKESVLAAVEEALGQTVAGTPVEGVNTVDGFKISLADGTWLLIRPSGTEPKMRIYAEAETETRVGELLAAGRELVVPLV